MTYPIRWYIDWFSSPYYNLLYHKRNDTEAQHFIDNLSCKMSFNKSDIFLDTACGSGRHAVYLNKLGFEVFGIDLSEKMICEAKKKESTSLHFFVHNNSHYFRTNFFSVVLNLFTSWGYFDTDRENENVIRSSSIALKKEGLFILDYLNPKNSISSIISNEKQKIDGVIFEINRFVEKNFLLKRILIKDNEKNLFFYEKLRMYSLKEIEIILFRNKLSVIYTAGDYQFKPFHETNSERIIIIAKKS